MTPPDQPTRPQWPVGSSIPAAQAAPATPGGSPLARLSEVLTAAEISHLIAGKSGDQLTGADWTRIARFVSGKRLDELHPPLQRLLIDSLCDGIPQDESEQETLWTVVLSVEPGNRTDLLREVRLLESIVAHEAGSVSGAFSVVRTGESRVSLGTTSRSAGPRRNTFTVPDSISTRNDRYALSGPGSAPATIGTGEHSAVFQARRHSDGRPVAIKIVHPRSPPLSFLREYLIHRRFAGDANVLQAYEAGRYAAPVEDRYDVFFFMVLEYGDMTLARLIEDRQSYTEDEETLKEPFLPHEKRFFSKSLLSIVESLHRHRILHCDIKPENIYLTVNGDTVTGVKIGDFGIARQIPPGVDKVFLGRFEGTPAFSPRTSIEKGEYSFYTDLFGYARTIACLEPGLYMTGIGQTTQQLVKRALKDTTGSPGLQATTTRQGRKSTLVKTRRKMERTLSSALFRLGDSGDPFVLFVILPILDPERYPFSPRVLADVAPLADAAYTVQDALDTAEAGRRKDALAILRELEAAKGGEPWYRIMASDLISLTRAWEREQTAQ